MMNKTHLFIKKRDYKIINNKIEKFSEYRINKIKNSRNKDQLSLNYEVENILIKALNTIYNFDEKLIINTDRQGKPYLVNCNYKFNISHSNEYIALAVGNEDIGLDIEEINDKRLSIAKKVFSKEDLIKEINSDLLIKHWTIKEAYIKLFSLNVLIDLTNIEVKDGNVFSSYGKGYYESYKKDNYYISVVTKNISEISLNYI